jgi:hypothetical protein
MQIYLRYFLGIFMWFPLPLSNLFAQNTFIGSFLQLHVSSPSSFNDNFYLPDKLSNDDYRSTITYKSQPGFSIGASVQHTVNERWSVFFIPSGQFTNQSFSNTITPKDINSEVDPFIINHSYHLYYLSTGIYVGFAPKGYFKKSLIARAGAALHTLLYQDYNSRPSSESPSKFNATFATLQVELGTRFILSNNKPLELTFAIEADVTGYEAAVLTLNNPFPKPANLFTAGMRVHYFLFN